MTRCPLCGAVVTFKRPHGPKACRLERFRAQQAEARRERERANDEAPESRRRARPGSIG